MAHHFCSRHLLGKDINWDEGLLVPGVNCTTPAYHEFPSDIFSAHQRQTGGILLHIFVVFYMFTALAKVCDDYFVPSLGKICELLGFSEDVAGATFMAAGSSAPELFTSIIGVFVARGDVGTGTIVGSAVFNILCIVGACALSAGAAVRLNWWPLVRDSTFYALSVVTLIFVIYDSLVTWYEAVIMLVMYSLYILVMKYNERLKGWAAEKALRFTSLPTEDENVTLTGYGDLTGNGVGNHQNRPMKDLEGGYQSGSAKRPSTLAEREDMLLNALLRLRSPRRRLNVWEVVMLYFTSRRFHARTRIFASAKLIIIERRRLIRSGQMSPIAPDQLTVHGERRKKNIKRSFSRQLTTEEEDPDDPSFDAWKVRPKFGEVHVYDLFKWWLMAPINFAFHWTIPDCRKTAKERFYLLSFSLSILWIAALSYIMVWMVALVGYTLGIPDSIMGITFLAAGTSIPDMMASIIVAKKGQGDMAVSNSVGSNVFDILLGLAFPWFLQTALVSPGSSVQINSNGLVFSVVLLFLTVGILVVGVAKNGWKLTKKLGIIFLITYGCFILISSLIESNVFGFVNPPNCPE